MSREAIETWDEDVLMGELMVSTTCPDSSPLHHHAGRLTHNGIQFCLPSAPHCRNILVTAAFPTICCQITAIHMHLPPGGLPSTTALGRPAQVARHSKWFKPSDGYEREWGRRIKGRVWKLPAWLDQYADEEAR
jgi:hypothetical protein